jgi:hypothetical protein
VLDLELDGVNKDRRNQGYSQAHSTAKKHLHGAKNAGMP